MFHFLSKTLQQTTPLNPSPPKSISQNPLPSNATNPFDPIPHRLLPSLPRKRSLCSQKGPRQNPTKPRFHPHTPQIPWIIQNHIQDLVSKSLEILFFRIDSNLNPKMEFFKATALPVPVIAKPYMAELALVGDGPNSYQNDESL
ncbi:hypothetical protein AAC387_Pa03g3887 [Persea americana]